MIIARWRSSSSLIDFSTDTCSASIEGRTHGTFASGLTGEATFGGPPDGPAEGAALAGCGAAAGDGAAGAGVGAGAFTSGGRGGLAGGGAAGRGTDPATAAPA